MCVVDWGDVATWLIFAATLAYVWITFRIWQNTKKTFESTAKAQQDTRDLFLALNNPYVGVVRTQFISALSHEALPHGVKATIKNFGHAPGMAVEVTVVISESEPAVQGPRQERNRQGLLMPGAEESYILPVPTEMFERAFEGTATFFVRTDIQYSSLDGKRLHYKHLARYYKPGQYFDVVESQFL